MNNPYLIDRYLLAELVDSHNNIHWEDIADMPKVDTVPMSVIEDIKAEIDYQFKWLMNTDCTLNDIDLAFDAIKFFINNHIGKEKKND